MKIKLNENYYVEWANYPILSIMIEETDELKKTVDSIREERGFLPFYDLEEEKKQIDAWDIILTEDPKKISFLSCHGQQDNAKKKVTWDDGWYNIFVDLDIVKNQIVDLYANVVGNNIGQEEMVPDDGQIYHLPFNADNLTRQIKSQIDVKKLHRKATEVLSFAA